VLEGLLRGAPDLTAPDVSQRWPGGVERPGYQALAMCLRELSDAGRLVRSGHGHRYATFRYRLRDGGPATAAPGDEVTSPPSPAPAA
jgi:hypothetical protein